MFRLWPLKVSSLHSSISCGFHLHLVPSTSDRYTFLVSFYSLSSPYVQIISTHCLSSLTCTLLTTTLLFYILLILLSGISVPEYQPSSNSFLSCGPCGTSIHHHKDYRTITSSITIFNIPGILVMGQLMLLHILLSGISASTYPFSYSTFWSWVHISHLNITRTTVLFSQACLLCPPRHISHGTANAIAMPTCRGPTEKEIKSEGNITDLGVIISETHEFKNILKRYWF